MNNIKKARLIRGLSQKYVAAALGVSAPSVSDWERGRTHPTAEKLQKLAKLLDFSVDYLLGENDADTSKETQAVPENSGLSESHIKLIEIAKTLSDEDAALLLAALKANRQ